MCFWTRATNVKNMNFNKIFSMFIFIACVDFMNVCCFFFVLSCFRLTKCPECPLQFGNLIYFYLSCQSYRFRSPGSSEHYKNTILHTFSCPVWTNSHFISMSFPSSLNIHDSNQSWYSTVTSNTVLNGRKNRLREIVYIKLQIPCLQQMCITV